MWLHCDCCYEFLQIELPERGSSFVFEANQRHTCATFQEELDAGEIAATRKPCRSVNRYTQQTSTSNFPQF